jgi:hypothetical protein
LPSKVRQEMKETGREGGQFLILLIINKLILLKIRVRNG